MKVINKNGGTITGCVVALDREEILDGIIARERIKEELNIEITSIAKISHLIEFFETSDRQKEAIIIKDYLSS